MTLIYQKKKIFVIWKYLLCACCIQNMFFLESDFTDRNCLIGLASKRMRNQVSFALADLKEIDKI